MTGTPPCYDKPIWTLNQLAAALPPLPRQLARVAGAHWNHTLSGALRERIMLAVASENRCRYCQLAHSEFGAAEGLSPEELTAILGGEVPTQLSPDEQLALTYARDLAARGFASHDAELRHRLARQVGEPTAQAVEATAQLMNLANRFGNTFDALLTRLARRCDRSGASWGDLLAISPLFAAGAAMTTPLVALAAVAGRLRRAATSR